jgi:predicted nucleic acid-binding protein
MDKFKDRAYNLCLTTEILLEYEEKLTEIFSSEAALPFMEALPDRSNVEWVHVFFRWNLIYPDLDDNKFVDCAIAARADYLVSVHTVCKRLIINILGVFLEQEK